MHNDDFLFPGETPRRVTLLSGERRGSAPRFTPKEPADNFSGQRLLTRQRRRESPASASETLDPMQAAAAAQAELTRRIASQAPRASLLRASEQSLRDRGVLSF